MSRREAFRLTAVTGAGLALGGGAIAALIESGRLRRVRVDAVRMGSPVSITVLHPDSDVARAMVTRTFAEMERLESVLSRHRDGTPLSVLNRSGELHDAPPELLEVVESALRHSTASAGAFDVTIAPLLALYSAHFAHAEGPPTEQRMARALSLVGYRKVHVDGRTIRLERPGMSLTLDGIAKGYIVDRAAATLSSAGAERVLVNAGGDLGSIGGAGPGEKWRIGIEDSSAPDGLGGTLEIAGDAVATSGDHVHRFTRDGRFHHIIDPRTGRSPTHTRSVTVLARTAFEADALSTAAFVLGPAEGLAMLDRHQGAEGLIMPEVGEARMSRGFRDRFTI